MLLLEDETHSEAMRIATEGGFAHRVKTRADVLAVVNGCVFNQEWASHAVAFFERYLLHSKGRWAGQPFKLLDWQKEDVIEPLFGWVGPDGKTRRFRQAFITVPKKNGKSTLLAGVSLYLLLADGEQGAEVFSAAADRDQAAIVFNEAAQMVNKSPELSRVLEVINSRKRIVFAGSGSFFRVLSRDPNSKEGLNIHGLTFDELHAQKNRDLFDCLRYGGASRDQPLLVSITTAGYDRHSICYEQYDYGKKVIDGIIEDHTFFAYIAEADADDDWTDPKTWHKANPSLGVTMKEEDFAADCNEAQESPRKENAFKRYRLNIWTEQETRFIAMPVWDACGTHELKEEDFHGRACFAGLDLSTTTDLTAAAYVFPDEDRFDVLMRFFIPEDNARERSKRDRVPYEMWEREGYIQFTPGNVVDFESVRMQINADAEKFDIIEIGADPWNAHDLLHRLEGDSHEVVAVRQGFASISSPTKLLETVVLSGKLRHGANPVLRWNASNVAIEMDPAGNIKPSKKKSIERIDGLVALIIALSRAGVAKHKPRAVYTKSRGLIKI